MICPGCKTTLKESPKNRLSINEESEHLWGICPYCKDLIHFFYKPAENFVYGWLGSRESYHAKKLAAVQGKKNILYLPQIEEGLLLEFCRGFATKFNWNVGFIIPDIYQNQIDILSSVYKVAVLENVLFPEHPSFVAEKIIVEHTPQKLYTNCETIFDKFEVYS